MKKSRIILAAAVLSLAAVFVTGCGNKVKPTFMYFYTNADTQTVTPIVDELKSEYEKKVNFTLINIDENPEALENFQLVSGNTPALIMLNTNNDISKFEFQCTDKDTLKADIEAALGK